jgi:RNA polymerase sigma factor (sigma-70 family)
LHYSVDLRHEVCGIGVFRVPAPVRQGRLADMADDGVARERDDELFAQLYPALRRFAAVVRPLEEDADDLVQEALMRALRLRPLCDYDDPAAYLRTVIVHLASNQRRGLGRRRRAYARSVDTTASRHASYPSDLDDLRRLGVRDRAVLYLALVEGRPYADVARTLGCTEEAARARASRALRRLRSDLEAEIADA